MQKNTEKSGKTGVLSVLVSGTMKKHRKNGKNRGFLAFFNESA